MEFLKTHINEEWWDLVNEFPEFIIDLSPYVKNWYTHMVDHHEKFNMSIVPIEDICNLRYGFECGIGWKNLIREYLTEVRKLISKAKENSHEIHYKTCIFKEKFGELRDQGDFYGKDRDIYIKEFHTISDILLNSLKTCEKCGNPATLKRKGFWVKTLCEDHSNNSYVNID